jgi:hypothetical protein
MIRVEFKDKLPREMKGGVPMFKHHVMKTCMVVKLRHSFVQGSTDFAKSSSHIKI